MIPPLRSRQKKCAGGQRKMDSPPRASKTGLNGAEEGSMPPAVSRRLCDA